MTRYFMRDTPLCQLEQQMMTPPNFKARGHGRYSPGFQYSSEDTECPYCINFRRNQPCPLKLCICLDERIAAGALNLNEFVRDCFFPEAGVQLLARLERNFTCCSISFFLNECHRERWQHWRERYYRMSGRNLAALFLLTAYIYLRDRANASGSCWPGIKTIASDLGLSRSTVKRAINELERKGFLLKNPRFRTNGSHTSNLYTVR